MPQVFDKMTETMEKPLVRCSVIVLHGREDEFAQRIQEAVDFLLEERDGKKNFHRIHGISQAIDPSPGGGMSRLVTTIIGTTVVLR